MRQMASWVSVLLPVLACVELFMHARIQAGVASDDEWRQAASLVRAQRGPHDLIVAAPKWADPIVRLHLGDVIPLAMAGRSDDAAYERMWVLSVRGALPADVPAGARPALQQRFGRVTVSRYDLGKSSVLYDFPSHALGAHATLRSAGVERPCALQKGGVPRGGGLGRGVLYPLKERLQCEERRSWLFVAPVVMEDLGLQPRYCIWQHPQGDDPISLTFDDVPLGDELVFYGGLYYEHERMREGGPVNADVFIDGTLRGKLVHRDGDGWKRMVVSTRGLPERGSVRVEVTAHAPDKRSLCWAASTRSVPPGSGQ